MPEPVTSILVVDDNDAERYYLTRILGKAGFRVIEAATGLDGLRLAESERPELVTLDIRLPDINGFEVCRRLKSNPPPATSRWCTSRPASPRPTPRRKGWTAGPTAT